MIVLNRLSLANFMVDVNTDLELKEQDGYLIFRNKADTAKYAAFTCCSRSACRAGAAAVGALATARVSCVTHPTSCGSGAAW
jgi:hypothetical protein